MDTIETQKEMIRQFLYTGARVDPLQALNWFGCSKLSTRCGEIEREDNVIIHRAWKEVKSKFGKKRVKEYFFKPIPNI